MLLVLIGIFLITAIVTGWLTRDDWDTPTSLNSTCILSCVAVFICVIAIINYTNTIVKTKEVQQNIQDLVEENSNLEISINEIAESYLQHEKETIGFSNLKDPNALVVMVPQLKSEQIVVRQIELYNANKQEIIDLKKQYNSAITARWWIYFGGKDE